MNQMRKYPNEHTAGTKEQEKEWIRQNRLIYGGLIGAGLIMVQPFLTAGSLSALSMVCVVAFSVSIPILAALVIVSEEEKFRQRLTGSVTANVAKVVAQSGAFIGLTAGFWNIHWLAGVGMVLGGIVGVAVHSAGFSRLYLES